jgi:orotate phosphoribosyltransferase
MLVKKRKIQIVDINKQIVESIVSRYKINKHITLSSGRDSDYYYDIKSLLLCGVDWKQIKNILIKDMKHKFPEMICVAGQGLGGMSLAMRISSCLEYNISPILIRDDQKEHGLLKQIEGTCPNGTARCVVVDDVTTTGKSFRKANKILNNHGIKVLGNYVLLKRKESHFDCECLLEG